MRVIIDRAIYNKVMYWVNKAGTKEVSGLGKCEWRDGAFYVTDAIMIEQTNTSGTTDLDEQATANAMFRMKDMKGDMMWWWHSHVQMGVFWSPTDKDTIDRMSAAGVVVATVFNQKYEMLSAVKQGAPFEIADLKVATQIVDYIPDESVAEWDKEYDDNVKLYVPPKTPQTYGAGGNSQAGKANYLRDLRESEDVEDERDLGLVNPYNEYESDWRELDAKRLGPDEDESGKKFSPITRTDALGYWCDGRYW